MKNNGYIFALIFAVLFTVGALPKLQLQEEKIIQLETEKNELVMSISEKDILIENLNNFNLSELSLEKQFQIAAYIYETDWEIDYRMFFNNYFGVVTWDLGSHFILSSNNMELLDSEVYGYSNEFSNLSNIKLRGYTITKEHYDFMTRAEFCDLVVWAKYNLENIPKYSVDFPIKYSYVGYKDLEERKVYETYVLGAFLKATDWLLNYYNARNGKIKIVEDSKWDVINHKDSVATYHHINGGPIISIRNITYEIVLHELGHFV